MRVYAMDDDGVPHLETRDGHVLMAVKDPDEGQFGFRLSAEGANKLAIRLLAQVAQLRGDGGVVVPATSFAIQEGKTSEGEQMYRIGVSVEGAVIMVQINAAQFSDAAALFARHARLSDENVKPRPDIP